MQPPDPATLHAEAAGGGGEAGVAPEGPMCTFKRDREAAHRPGRCLVASKDLYNNAVFNSNDWYMGAIAFNKVALPQVAMCNSLEAWMVEVKEALYSAYQEEGGVAVC